VSAGSVEDMPFEVSDFTLDPEPVEVPIVKQPAPAMARRRSRAPVAKKHRPRCCRRPSTSTSVTSRSISSRRQGNAGERAAERAATAVAEAELPELDLPGTDVNEPMARKIELADEFRASAITKAPASCWKRSVSKADGALRSRAQTMLDALG
jgi:hypothetical protein